MPRRYAAPTIAVAILGVSVAAVAQRPMTFANVFIRISAPETSGTRITTSRGYYIALNASLSRLIQDAYRVEPFQIANVPEAIADARFDLEASVPTGTPTSRIPSMARELLAREFQLRLRSETRQLPGYALVVLREDRRLGSHLTVSPLDCSGVKDTGPVSAFIPATHERGRPICGITAPSEQISAAGASMEQLATVLAGQVGRPVADQTGLKGFFDFDLDAASPSSVPAALEKHLGLALQPKDVRTTVLVIEHVVAPACCR